MTMKNLAALQAVAAAAAEVASVDITETSKGTAQRVLESGKYLGRFIEYIEYGTQKNTFEASKPPRAVCRIAFAVFPYKVNENGERIGIEDEPVIVRTSDLTISNHEQASLKGLYNRMNYSKDATKTHIAFFLGQPFVVGIEKYLTKSNAERNKVILTDVGPALDMLTNAPLPVPNVSDDMYRAFFWEHPTPETWEALFIEGTRDDGKSKNFIQETILAATDYSGSALELMLTGASSIPLPDASTEVPSTEADTPPWEGTQTAAATEAVVEVPEVPVVPNFPV